MVGFCRFNSASYPILGCITSFLPSLSLLFFNYSFAILLFGLCFAVFHNTQFGSLFPSSEVQICPLQISNRPKFSCFFPNNLGFFVALSPGEILRGRVAFSPGIQSPNPSRASTLYQNKAMYYSIIQYLFSQNFLLRYPFEAGEFEKKIESF